MVTLILGGQASGKTTLAKQMTQDKKTVWLDRSKFWSAWNFMNVTNRTKCIVIEEITDTDIIYFLNGLCYHPVHRPLKKDIMIDFSKRDIILTSNTIKKENLTLSILGNTKIIELQKNN